MNVWLILFVVILYWLLFIIIFKSRWNDVVEKENMYWMRKLGLSPLIVGKIIKFEQGMGMKIILVISLVLCVFNFIYRG